MLFSYIQWRSIKELSSGTISIYTLFNTLAILLSLAKMLNQEEPIVLDERYRQMIKEDLATKELSDFQEALSIISSRKADIDNQHRAAILIRKYVQTPSSKTCVLFRKKDIVTLIELSHKPQYPQLRYQALRILINMSFCSANHGSLINHGAVQLFSSLIYHENVQISRLAMRGIGNIAAGYNRREIQQDVLKLLLEFQKTSKDDKTNEFLLWALANMLQHVSISVDIEALTALLPVYDNFAPEYVNEVWIYTVSQYFQNEKISILFESGTVSHLFNYLKSSNKKLVYETIGLIFMIISGGHEYIGKLIELDFIGHISRLLENQSPHYSQITYLLDGLSQLANNSCKRLLAESDVIIKKMLAFPSKQPDNFLLKLELGYFIFNIFPFTNSFKLFNFCKQTKFVSMYLDDSEPLFIRRLMKSLPLMLELGNRFKENGKNVLVETLRQEGAVEKWQRLLLNEDEQLVSFILMILDRYIYP